MIRFPIVAVFVAGAAGTLLFPIDAAAHPRGVAETLERGHRDGAKLRPLARAALAMRVRDLPPAGRDALALERFYRRQGRPEQAAAMYAEVLERSRDPQVRQLAHRRLARWAWRQGDAAGAERHLRASLEENLK